MGCHEGYDHDCGNRCVYPRCRELRHLSNPGPSRMGANGMDDNGPYERGMGANGSDDNGMHDILFGGRR